jgi:small subunit ribosomal protein S17
MSARAVAPAVSAAARTVTRTPSGGISRELSGIVVSAGLAKNTVKVQVAKEEWNKKVKKVSMGSSRGACHNAASASAANPTQSLTTSPALVARQNFQHFERYLVHDPNDSLRTGDIVSISSGWRTSKSKRHVVNRIIAPWGPPIEDRPPVPTAEEREAAHAAERAKKVARKQLRAQAQAMERAVAKAQRTTEELASRAGELGYRAS